MQKNQCQGVKRNLVTITKYTDKPVVLSFYEDFLILLVKLIKFYYTLSRVLGRQRNPEEFLPPEEGLVQQLLSEHSFC